MLYRQLKDALDTAKDKSKGKPYGNNTRLYKTAFLYPYGRGIAVRFYKTSILRAWPDGTIILNTAGWKTVSTKKRLNKLLQPYGYYISQHKHVWYLHAHGVKMPYVDGMQLTLESEAL